VSFAACRSELGDALAVVADVGRVDASVVLGDSTLELLPELLHGVAAVLLLRLGSGSPGGDNDGWSGGARDGGGVCGDHVD